MSGILGSRRSSPVDYNTNRPMNGYNVRYFNYRNTAYRIIATLVLVGWAIFLVLMPVFETPNWLNAEIFFGLGFIFSLLLFLNYLFGTSRIKVNENGISRYIFKWHWNEIKWHEIDHVTAYNLFNYSLFKTIQMYAIYRTKESGAYIGKTMGMSFDETICGFGELVDIMELQSKRCGFPIIRTS